VAARLTIASLAGLEAEEIDERLAGAIDDTALEGLADELADSFAARMAVVPFDRDEFVVRLVVVERRGVYERDVEYLDGRWRVAHAPRTESPHLVSRWQGFAPLVRCENGDLHVQSAAIVGLCEVEGTVEDQEAVMRCLALGTDEAMARVFMLRGLSDRELARELEHIDMPSLVRDVTEIGAEVARHLGSGSGLGRTVVTQLEVEHQGQTYVTQTVVDGETTTVHEHAVLPPTVTVRFANPVDFARICTTETTPVELVASGKVEVEGDISMFAQVDMLRW